MGMDTLADLIERFEGSPIPHCPGRYVLRSVDSSKGPASLVDAPGDITEHLVAKARDRVVRDTTRGRGPDLLRSSGRIVAAHREYA